MKPLRLALVVLILALPVCAQQDSGASLTIRFASGTNSFHVGEVILLELSFQASIPDSYDMGTRNYDRSGRLNIEQYHVMPPGRDPLQNYYNSLEGIAGGGPSSGPRLLSKDPQIIRDDLNEWVALDRPGHYSLYVTSGRVSRRDVDKDEPVELRSNTLEFDVVAADPGWQQQTLSTAVTTLNIDSSTGDEKAAALRALRFLDSPGSVQELVRLLGTHSAGGDWNEIAGLAGSRFQSLVVRELEQQMNAPDVALTGDYLSLLARLKVQLDHGPLPHYPEKDPQEQAIWKQRWQAQDKEFTELRDSLYARAAELLLSKGDTAQAETVAALLQGPPREPGNLKPLGGLPPGEVASAFLNLSPDQQWELLTASWDHLKVPAMVQPLEKVAQQPDMKLRSVDVASPVGLWLRDLVFRRLYDLDPSEAAPIFLEEIRHPHVDAEDATRATVKGETLALLSNETLPEFDDLLSARLGQKQSYTRGLDAQLVARYSTPATLAKVKSIYEASAGRWDCVTKDGFVLYFLRVDPDYGVKRLAVAPSVCMTNSLPAVIKMNRWSEVEPGIIARLNGPDLNRARQAAETLAKHGSPQAEMALWDRMRRFHAQWAERQDELTYRARMQKDAKEAMGFETGLVNAIGTAQAWLLTNDEITALESLTLGRERDRVEHWHWSSPVDLNVSLWGGIDGTINLQYSAEDLASLRGKLAQYPAGTTFRLNISSPEEDRVTAMLAAINGIAAEHGFQVDNSPATQ